MPESAAAATRVAVELARATGDVLVVVTVWRELRGDFGVPIDSVFPDVKDIERDHALRIAESVAGQAAAQGLKAEVVIRHGSPAREISALARELRPRLIVIGSQGWGAVERAVFGSVSERVLHHAPCPVLVVPSEEALARRG